jgi:hypothetical protein
VAARLACAEVALMPKRPDVSPDLERARYRYRKVELGMWHDASFLAMTPPEPSGQWLWVYLLTGPRTTQLPGLVVAREAVMADDLRWDVEGFRKAFGECFQEGLLDADWKAGVVVLRKALLTSSGAPRETARPGNPNVLKSWSQHLRQVPDCGLKTSYLRTLKSFAEALGKPFAEAFGEAFGEALAKAPTAASHIRNQESGHRRGEERARGEDSDLPLLPGSDSADPEASRAHAIAPELEQQRVDSPGLAELKSRVNAATGDIGRRRAEQPRDLAQERRARLRVKTFDALGALRMQIASELKLQNVRPLHPHDGGERDLADRIVESGAQAEASCEHVLACAVQAARGGRTVKWLTGSLFGEKQWRRFLGTTPAEAFADAEREWRRLNPDAPIASTPIVNVSDDEDAARTRAELEAEHQKRLALAAKREAKERAARDAEQQKDPA